MENHIQKILCDSAKNVIESVFEIDFKTGKYTTVFTAATQTSPYGEQSWNAFADRFAGNYSVSGRKDELERALSLENIKMALSADGKYRVYGGKIPGKEQKGYKELIFTFSENPETAILSIIDFSRIADYYHKTIRHMKDEFRHDNITGTYNRDYYETNLKNLRLNGGVAIIDIDDFKIFNDTYGHNTGDIALSETSRIIRENLSENDMLIRYGGDEFLIIMPDVSVDNLENTLERIRTAISSVRHWSLGNMRLSVSVGGVIENGGVLENAVYRADRVMYLAKNHKNKVMTERRLAKIPTEITEENTEKQLVLIVDDSEFNRELLKEMLIGTYALAEASSGRQCLRMLDKYGTKISAVLLDIIMPEMDGFEVLSRMKEEGYLEDIPVIMITADDSEENLKKAFNMGVSDYIHRPFDANVVKRRIQNIAFLYAKQRRMLSMLAEQINSREKNNRIMIDILSNVVGCINSESIAHIQNLRKITMMLLERLNLKTDKYGLSWQDCRNISVASSLHDIGKVLIDPAILNKPGKLTAKEYEIMKEHTVLGEKILHRGELASFQNEPLLKTAIQICRYHHERYDGKGYPDGLCGDDIPIAAQVVGIADVYDALVNDRSYKKAIPGETALEMISRGDCGCFNPVLIECLKDIKEKLTLDIYG